MIESATRTRARELANLGLARFAECFEALRFDALLAGFLLSASGVSFLERGLHREELALRRTLRAVSPTFAAAILIDEE